MAITKIVTLAVTSGLVAGIITTIGNIIITIFNRIKDSKMEDKKYQNSLDDFRYKKIHENLVVVSSLPTVTYDISTQESVMNIVKQSNEHFSMCTQYYNITIPLLDKTINETLKKSYENVEKISNKGVEHIYGNGERDFDIMELLMARVSFKNKFIEAMQEQLQLLLQQ